MYACVVFLSSCRTWLLSLVSLFYSVKSSLAVPLSKHQPIEQLCYMCSHAHVYVHVHVCVCVYLFDHMSMSGRVCVCVCVWGGCSACNNFGL